MERKHACLAYEIDARVAAGGACGRALPVHRRVRVRASTRTHSRVCIRPSRSAAAPDLALGVHVGAVREQRRHHVGVPVDSGVKERRPPAADRARAHTAGAAV
jgi:hypothetical protein